VAKTNQEQQYRTQENNIPEKRRNSHRQLPVESANKQIFVSVETWKNC